MRAILVTLLTLPVAAWAVDVPVLYNVDATALKSAVAGTMLTFELHTTSACSSAVLSQTVASEHVSLISKLKAFKVSGGPTPPKVNQLLQVLTGAPSESVYYLKVTGTGITPVGGACQLQAFSSGVNALPCASQVGNDVFFNGCNVNVRSGSGSTNGTVNGKGNVIIGYNEGAGATTGSHNLIVGTGHSFSSFGGIVAGHKNSIEAPFASVTGGTYNTASGYTSSVSGGTRNYASAYYSSVSGGRQNSATAYAASVSGGYGNQATGEAASVSGGAFNYATTSSASVSGGRNNHAQGDYSSVSGGGFNYATDRAASVSGGTGNYAAGRYASVSGGARNHANAYWASVSGGYKNTVTATGRYASISGGMNNSATAHYATVGGGTAVANATAGTWHAGQDGGFPTGTEY